MTSCSTVSTPNSTTRTAKEPPQGTIQMVDYAPHHAADFERLNRRWLEADFVVEDYDNEVLSNPDTHIIQPGGTIVMAEFVPSDGSQTVVVGAVGMMPIQRDGQAPIVEMTKLAVDPSYQGFGIGRKLCQALINKALAMGYSTMELASNRKLTPALTLYQSMGFVEIPLPADYCEKYQRCNITMELQMRKGL